MFIIVGPKREDWHITAESRIQNLRFCATGCTSAKSTHRTLGVRFLSLEEAQAQQVC